MVFVLSFTEVISSGLEQDIILQSVVSSCLWFYYCLGKELL
jgi:hypothetical protein